MTDERVEFTAAPVTEVYGYADADASAHKIINLIWTPVVSVAKVFKKANGTTTWVELTLTTDYTVDTDAGTVSLVTALVDGDEVKVAYVYDNAIFPANDLPRIKAHMEGIELAAKVRRIAIEYSQLAAFQLKNETGADLGKILATQAVSELNYEIDSEIIALLDKTAGAAVADTTFNKVPNVGVSRAEHYEGFAEVVYAASRIIFDRTKKFEANYMVIASNIKEVLSLTRGWKEVNTAKNGPYYAGTFNGLKVFVSPQLAAGRFFVGFNADELSASAAIYAPLENHLRWMMTTVAL